jgi:regulatory protein YycI of two-component signal transduction system YycFG
MVENNKIFSGEKYSFSKDEKSFKEIKMKSFVRLL